MSKTLPSEEEVRVVYAKVEHYETVLANIANGYWNVGRKPGEGLTAREYAREALRDPMSPGT